VNGLICGAVLGATMAWLSYASSALIPTRAGTSIPDQLAFMTSDLGRYARVVYWTLLSSGQQHYEEMIGVLGWLNVPLPAFAYGLPLVGLLSCIATPPDDAGRMPLHLVVWFIVLAAGAAFLTLTALYLSWTPVGLVRVDGLQVRYLLPLLLPLAAAFALRSVRVERWAGLAVVFAIAVSAAVAGYEAVDRLINPHDVTHLGALAAAGLIGYGGNWIAAQIRTRAGNRLSSPALVADGNHARADAYVSLGVVASGISYLGSAADVVAAGLVEQDMAAIAGFGRTAFAYPDFARDIESGAGMQKAKSCLACTKCTELMRAGTTAGCPVRDQEIYLPLYREYCMKKEG
jgi:hypothetical protein